MCTGQYKLQCEAKQLQENALANSRRRAAWLYTFPLRPGPTVKAPGVEALRLFSFSPLTGAGEGVGQGEGSGFFRAAIV